jgi:hypothetical protein
VPRIRDGGGTSSRRCSEPHASSRVVQHARTRCVYLAPHRVGNTRSAFSGPRSGPEMRPKAPEGVTFPASSSRIGPGVESPAQGRHGSPTSSHPCDAASRKSDPPPVPAQLPHAPLTSRAPHGGHSLPGPPMRRPGPSRTGGATRAAGPDPPSSSQFSALSEDFCELTGGAGVVGPPRGYRDAIWLLLTRSLNLIPWQPPVGVVCPPYSGAAAERAPLPSRSKARRGSARAPSTW